ncbi:MAG: DUF1566 domain-containing protein [Polyangia bacterium]
MEPVSEETMFNKVIVWVTAVFLSAVFVTLSCGEAEELDDGIDADSGSGGDSDTALECEGGRLDPNTGLCWQHPSQGGYDWNEAVDYCGELVLAGHSDWVLPSRDDFSALLGDCDDDVLSGYAGYCNSCNSSETCGELWASNTEWYWISSECGPDLAWTANFENGHIICVSKPDLDTRVRCVRSQASAESTSPVRVRAAPAHDPGVTPPRRGAATPSSSFLGLADSCSLYPNVFD